MDMIKKVWLSSPLQTLKPGLTPLMMRAIWFRSPLASLVPTMLSIWLSRMVVSSVMLTPVRPMML